MPLNILNKTVPIKKYFEVEVFTSTPKGRDREEDGLEHGRPQK